MRTSLLIYDTVWKSTNPVRTGIESAIPRLGNLLFRETSKPTAQPHRVLLHRISLKKQLKHKIFLGCQNRSYITSSETEVGFEPTTSGFSGQCLVRARQLGHRHLCQDTLHSISLKQLICKIFLDYNDKVYSVARGEGIEPSSPTEHGVSDRRDTILRDPRTTLLRRIPLKQFLHKYIISNISLISSYLTKKENIVCNTVTSSETSLKQLAGFFVSHLRAIITFYNYTTEQKRKRHTTTAGAFLPADEFWQKRKHTWLSISDNDFPFFSRIIVCNVNLGVFVFLTVIITHKEKSAMPRQLHTVSPSGAAKKYFIAIAIIWHLIELQNTVS